MPPIKFENLQNCLVNTGNILSLNDITKKSAQNTITEELTEAIAITVKEFENENPQDSSESVIHRANDDLQAKMSEEPLSNLKTGLKIFLSDANKDWVKEAIIEALHTLKVPSVHNVIVSFTKRNASENDVKSIWGVLEEYVKNEKICQIGLADIEESTFREIFNWAFVKPKIIQINLASCCVVPPTLQAFCKDNDVQLLTHSDPSDILPKHAIEESLGFPFAVKWILRFLVHIRCRGVLATKGYLVSLGK